MTRVLLVGKGPPDRGGIAAFLQTVVSRDFGDRWDLRLVNLTRDEPPQSRKLSLHNLRRLAQDTWSVWRAARRGDIVHIHSALASHPVVLRAGALALAGRARGARVIVHAHSGRAAGWFTTPSRRRLGRLALFPAQRVVAVAEGGRAVLALALGDHRITLIENGVDLSSFGPPEPPHDPPRILFAGVLTARKGVGDLLAASEQLRGQGVAHEVWLVGGTPDEGVQAESEVRAQAARNAVWLGPHPHEEMARFYRAADVFCLPSWGEAMPLSVLEAMASGLPVVASRVGDIPRAVENGITGVLVPPRDPQALAAALAPLLRDPALRQRLGSAGRERARRHFDADATATALERLYRELEDG